MLPVLARIGPMTLTTYTALLDVAILLGLAVLTRQGHRVDGRPTAWLDAGLAALAAGIAGGRLAHIALHWAYFAERPAEIFAVWQGGLEWHGAVLAGLLGAFIAARVMGLHWLEMTDALAYVLPAGAVMAFTGCLMARCAAGAEVASLADYPPLIVAELPDLFGIEAPRFATQFYGVLLALIVLGAARALARIVKRPGVRFGLVLALLSAGAFGIGFFRGDAVTMVGPLRIDQLLDLLTAALGLAGAIGAGRMATVGDRLVELDDTLSAGDGALHGALKE